MAETLDFATLRGAVIRITDATGGTPKTYDIPVRSGSCTMTAGGWEVVRQRDTNGDLEAIVKKGQQAGVSTFAIEAHLNDPGNNSSEAVLSDFVAYDGYVEASWASTGSSLSSFKQFTVSIILPSVGGAVVTYTLTKCHAQPGHPVTLDAEGLKLSVTFESNVPMYEKTRA